MSKYKLHRNTCSISWVDFVQKVIQTLFSIVCILEHDNFNAPFVCSRNIELFNISNSIMYSNHFTSTISYRVIYIICIYVHKKWNNRKSNWYQFLKQLHKYRIRILSEKGLLNIKWDLNKFQITEFK